MLSIEDRIAEYCILPSPEKRWCEVDGCKTALARANGGHLCYRHAELEAEQRLQEGRKRKYSRVSPSRIPPSPLGSKNFSGWRHCEQ